MASLCKTTEAKREIRRVKRRKRRAAKTRQRINKLKATNSLLSKLI